MTLMDIPVVGNPLPMIPNRGVKLQLTGSIWRCVDTEACFDRASAKGPFDTWPSVCEDCKSSNGKLTTCPFDSDVHDKRTPAILCENCEKERAKAI